MIAVGQPITRADLQALATLASSKIGGTYDFPAFAGTDAIGLVSDIKPSATYGIGIWNPGVKVTLWLYSYKTIAGTKTYSWMPSLKAFYPVLSSGVFTMTWTWTNPTGPTAPDGYIAVIPSGNNTTGWTYSWKDIGLVNTLSDNGQLIGWNNDSTLDQNNNGFPAENLPCGHGAWLKPLNLIHQTLFQNMDLFGGHSITFDPSFLLSGPWCVSIAPKCHLYLNNTSIYDSLQFWYSEADSLTGNELSPQSDMFNTYTGAQNDANNFDWSENVVINGRMVIESLPAGQSASDWVLSASDPGIVITFDGSYFDPLRGSTVTGFIFDFNAIQYTVGTPITLTVHATAGGVVVDSGNPAGTGCLVNCTFTGDKTVYSASDALAIHQAGAAAKSASLPNSLTKITMTTGIGGNNPLEAYYKAYCNGVFVAKTLPTLGIMTYLDQDLPQYHPRHEIGNASDRRTALNDALAYIPHVDNRGALWPVFKQSDFTPDNVAGLPFNGSKAWQALAVTYVSPDTVSASIPPTGTNPITLVTFFRTAPTDYDFRVLASDPNVTVYVKHGAQPTVSDYDFKGLGGAWLDALVLFPSFPADLWYVCIENPTAATINLTLKTVVIGSNTAPNGTFFPTTQDVDGVAVPNIEGYSYHWSEADPIATPLRPIPLLGYCVYSITIRRMPQDNGSEIALAPSTGTSALNVDIGVMAGYGYNTAGTFQKLDTITIPAGQAGMTKAVFWPVLSGAPLVSPQSVMIRAAVNFQPIMHSQFDLVNNGAQVSGGPDPYPIGYYNGQPFYNSTYALLSFTDTNLKVPILLPISATIYNDLENLLNLLP